MFTFLLRSLEFAFIEPFTSFVELIMMYSILGFLWDSNHKLFCSTTHPPNVASSDLMVISAPLNESIVLTWTNVGKPGKV